MEKFPPFPPFPPTPPAESERSLVVDRPTVLEIVAVPVPPFPPDPPVVRVGMPFGPFPPAAPAPPIPSAVLAASELELIVPALAPLPPGRALFG